MPHIPIDIELTRSTLCGGVSHAKGEILCSDRIPEGQPSFLFVDIDWSRWQGDIVLTFRNPTSGGGDILFDGPNGPREKRISGDTRRLLTLYGKSRTAGDTPDVELIVKLENRKDRTLPSVFMSVGPLATDVQIRAENGVDPAPDSVLFEEVTRFRAVLLLSIPGTFRWFSVQPAALEIKGSAKNALVEVVGHRVSGSSPPPDRTLCVLFTPQSGLAVMALHKLRSKYQGQIEDRSVAPDYGEVATGHRFLPAGTPFTILDRNGVVVFSGTTDANGRFRVPLTLEEYELKVAGYEGLKT